MQIAQDKEKQQKLEKRKQEVQEFEALKQRAAEKKIDIDYICKVKNVNSVEEFTFDMWQNAMNWLEKKPNK